MLIYARFADLAQRSCCHASNARLDAYRADLNYDDAHTSPRY